MNEFDCLLDEVGGFGRYQIFILISLMYYQVPGGLNTIAPIFISFTPDFRCQMYPFDNATLFPNLTNSDILNLTTPTDDKGKAKNPCVRYSYDTSECAENDDFSCVNTSSSTIECKKYHYETSLFIRTTVTEFDLVCNRQLLEDLSTSVYLVGVLVSSITSGYFLDRFGRKIPTVIFTIGMLVFMLVTAYSSSVEMFIVGRFLIAFFCNGTHLGVFCHILEIVGTRFRMMAGTAYHSAYCAGYMLWSAVAFVYRDWHEMQLACLVLSAPLLFILIVVPESPRWLFVKGYFEKAKKIIRLMAKMNKRDLRSKSVIENGLNENKIQKYSTLDLFRRPGLRKSTFKIGFYSLVNNTVYFGIAYNMGTLAGNIFLNNVYGGLLEISGNILCLVAVGYAGRRLLMSFTLTAAGLLLIGSAVLDEFADRNEALFSFSAAFMIIAKGLISGSTSVFCCFVVEFYPTVVRGNGIGFSSTAARVGSITSPFLIGVGSYTSLGWLPNSIFGIAAVAAGIVALTLPDTTGIPMMETIEEAEVFITKGKNERNCNIQGIDNIGYGSISTEELKA